VERFAMLRITQVDGRDAVPTLRLEGKLSGPWVEELLRVCAPPAAGPLRLDLSAVTYVDGAGLDLLRALLRRGVTVGACSGFVAQLLHVENG
jgi:anti-anti-sigma regulatory factor